MDAVLIMLAWPRGAEDRAPSPPRPRFLASLLSCAVLTVLVGLVMSPVVTLMFGVALLPFSWPYLAAVPIDPVYGVTALTPPGKDIGAFQFNGTGNQHHP